MNFLIATLVCTLTLGMAEYQFYKFNLSNKKNVLISFLLGLIGCNLVTWLYIGRNNIEGCSTFKISGYSFVFSFIYVCIIVTFVFKVMKRKIQNISIGKIKKCIFIIFFTGGIAFSLELLVFNYKSLITRSNQPVQSPYVTGIGLEYVNDNQYIVKSTEDCFIKFDNFSSHINSLRVNIGRYDARDKRMGATTASFYATDKANSLSFRLGSRDIMSSVKASQYVYMHLKGISNEMIIGLDADEGDLIYINDIVINPCIPVIINYWRVISVFAVLLLLYVFRPNSFIYDCTFSRKRKYQWIIIALFVLIESVISVKFATANKSFDESKWGKPTQYHELAEALSKGHFYLDEEPSEALLQMENPYDTNARSQAMSESNQTYLWDHAYYEGKYYVYFGIVPELLFYYPYYMFTHKIFMTRWAVAIGLVLLIISLTLLVSIILEKWFKDTSLGVCLLMMGVIVNSTGLQYIIAHPDIYNLPILMALVFAALGLYFWISSIQENKINGIYLTLGSLCMALIAGCRPQLVLLSFVALPLFMRKIVREKMLFSQSTILKTICAFVPFIIVASGIMYYNYARFGSVFEFGAKYNLTVNDVTNRIVSLELCIAGFFLYFLQPAYIGMTFPFIQASSMDYSYLGINFYEPIFGGLILTNPILLIILKLKDIIFELKKKHILGITVFILLLSFGISIVDIIGGGVLPRYTSDFALFLFLGALICVLTMDDKYSESTIQKKRGWRKKLLILVCCSLVYNALTLFTNTPSNYRIGNSELYYNFCYGIQFWL